MGVDLGVVSGILVWTGYQGFDEQRTLQIRGIRIIDMRYYLTVFGRQSKTLGNRIKHTRVESGDYGTRPDESRRRSFHTSAE